ncbi:response regulator transcription factor [Paenibacillus methanolicus]|uniref:Two-component system response regulator YesN n=1 Tax=Paenibacillus methanolicus TaxID=582686 RepID=A0A5S5CAQ7_9BACL|nr:response regulator [Paenibacillus methanolicus]TYP76491.1 two-component system response regulator YesN [Paenibacillus methanolicus]
MRGKLLLVEDQAFFRKGLRKMIDENATGWTVVGEAENGEEALALIAEQTPDLILTDIRMPGMDGIAFAERVREMELESDLIILTGYEDFAYAQAAVRFGAIDFLLKPCNEATLLGVLDKAHRAYQAKLLRREQLQAEIRSREEAHLRAALLRLPYYGPETNAQSWAKGRDITFAYVDDYFPEEKPYRPENLGLLQFAVANILAEHVGRDGNGRIVQLAFDRFALIHGKGDQAQWRQAASASIRHYLGLSVTLVEGGQIGRLADLPDRYERSYEDGQIERARLGTASSLARFGSPAGSCDAKVKECQLVLTMALASGDPERLRQALGEMVDRIAGLQLGEAKLAALALAIALRTAASQTFQSSEDERLFGDRIGQLQRARTVKETSDWAEASARRFLQLAGQWREQHNHNVIARIRDYLERHYAESCTLNEIAERFHLSPAYLSKLFKKETGENYSAYLTKARIDKAALLLANTDRKVFEIAADVGYEDPNYFTNVFRMLYRMSPSEYRKQTR